MRRGWKDRRGSGITGQQREKSRIAGRWGQKRGLAGGWRRPGQNCAALCCTALLLFSLSGCQLAREEEMKGQDVLCGILVTTQEQEDACKEARGETKTAPESITLTEKELRELADGGSPRILSESPRIQVEGVRQENGDIVFEGLEDGSFLGGYREKDTSGEYLHFTSTGVITDMKAGSSTTDAGEINSTEGTVSISQTADVTVNLNLVYQRPDGSLYALLDSAPGYWNSGQTGPGGVLSRSYKEEQTLTVGGKKVFAGQEFTVHLAVGVGTGTATVKEWGAGDLFLGETPLKKGQEQVTLKEDTEYFLVEETKGDGTVKRSAYTWDEKTAEEGLLCHTLFYEDGYGLLKPDTVSFGKR